MDIFVDATGLIKQAKDIALIRQQMQNNMERIETLILSVDGSWQGDAEKTYESKLLFVKRQFERLIEFFDEYSKALENCAEQYQTQDDKLKSSLNFA